MSGDELEQPHVETWLEEQLHDPVVRALFEKEQAALARPTRRERRAARAMARTARKKAVREKRAAGDELNAAIARARDAVDADIAHVHPLVRAVPFAKDPEEQSSGFHVDDEQPVVDRDLKPENVPLEARAAAFLDGAAPVEPELSLAEKIRRKKAAK